MLPARNLHSLPSSSLYRKKELIRKKGRERERERERELYLPWIKLER